MENKIKKIISDTIKVKILTLDKKKKIKDFSSFDSLATIKIILEIKKIFNVQMDFSDFDKENSLLEVFNKIENKIK